MNGAESGQIVADFAPNCQQLGLDDFTAQKAWFLLVTQGENCVSPLGEPHRFVALRAVKSY